MATSRKNPWKAIVAYSDTGTIELNYEFMGRDREAREIIGLIQYNDVVTLYGNSSVGKTSLLNAAVFPLIRQLGYTPVKKRLETKEKIEAFIEQLQEPVDDPIVFVLDQFEEAFKADSEATARLLSIIAEIVENSSDISSDTKFLIAIRQDDLYLLEEVLSRLHLDNFRNNRYYLSEFDEDTAYNVVSTLGHNYLPSDPEAAKATINKIIDYVKRICDGRINPMILSLVCHELWENAHGDKVITEKQVDKLDTSGNILEEYYKSAIKDLNRSDVLWIESALIDRNGRRKQVPVKNIPSFFRWQKHTPDNNPKNPILNLSSNAIEFIHDRLSFAAWSVKKSRGDERRPFIWLWCIISAVLFVWVFSQEDWIFADRTAAQNRILISGYSLYYDVFRPIPTYLATIVIILLPLLWAVGLDKCNRKALGIIGIVSFTCIWGVWDSSKSLYEYTLYSRIVQCVAGTAGLGLMVYALYETFWRKKYNNSSITLGQLFKNLWLYHFPFRLLLLICIAVTLVLRKRYNLISGGLFDYFLIGGMFYFLLFPKISKQQAPTTIIYFTSALLIALSDFPPILWWTPKSLINSWPVLLLFIVSVLCISYSICKWHQSYYMVVKIPLVIVSCLFLAITYVFSIGFNPIKNPLFDTYLYKYRNPYSQTVMVKKDNAFSINAAWTGEQLTPPIILGIDKFLNTKNNIYYCNKVGYVNLRQDFNENIFGGDGYYYITDDLIMPFSDNKWIKTSYSPIERGYYEFLSHMLSHINGDSEPNCSDNLLSVYNQILGSIEEYLLQNNEMNKNSSNPDSYSFKLLMCQALCVATMLDNMSNPDFCIRSAYYSLLCYQTLFSKERFDNTNFDHHILNDDIIYRINLNTSILQTSNIDDLNEALIKIWKALVDCAYSQIITNISTEFEKLPLLIKDFREVAGLIKNNFYNTWEIDYNHFGNYRTVHLLGNDSTTSLVNSINDSKSIAAEFQRYTSELTGSPDRVTKDKYINSLLNATLKPLGNNYNNYYSKEPGGLYVYASKAHSDKYIIKMMFYDEIALSILTDPQAEYLSQYGGGMYKERTVYTKNPLWDLSSNDESELFRCITNCDLKYRIPSLQRIGSTYDYIERHYTGIQFIISSYSQIESQLNNVTHPISDGKSYYEKLLDLETCIYNIYENLKILDMNINNSKQYYYLYYDERDK